MVGATGHGFHDTLHLQREQQGGQLADGDIGLHADGVQLQVVGLSQQVDEELLVIGEIGKKLSLHGLRLAVAL